MSDEHLSIRDAMRREQPEFRELEEKHHQLKRALIKLSRRKILTPQEALKKKEIQVEKLHTKDRIEAMIRLHQK